MEVAKGMHLRTLIKVTFGYPARFLTRFGRSQIGTNARVVASDVDPGIKAFIAVVRLQNISRRSSGRGGKTH